MIKIIANKIYSLGHQVQLLFQLTQHSRDSDLMICIKDFLNCGYVSKNREAFNYRVTKLDDIEGKIIPFFQKYTIHGVKALDFAD